MMFDDLGSFLLLFGLTNLGRFVIIGDIFPGFWMAKSEKNLETGWLQ